jgi:hypothetical protein
VHGDRRSEREVHQADLRRLCRRQRLRGPGRARPPSPRRWRRVHGTRPTKTADSPSACTSASTGPGAPLYEVVDESDADQILAIDELRALRDRTWNDAPPPEALTSAAPIEVPNPATAMSLEDGDDPWEDLRRRATERRRWGRLVAAGGCLAVTGGVIALVFTSHGRSVPPPAVKVPVPAVSAPAVSPAAPAAASSAAEPALPLPAAPTPSAVLPAPVVVTPSPSAQDAPEPQPAAVPAPAATHRKPPSYAPHRAPQPAPMAPAEGSAPGAAQDRTGTPGWQDESPQATLTRTPTSWSPESP